MAASAAAVTLAGTGMWRGRERVEKMYRMTFFAEDCNLWRPCGERGP